MKKTFATLAILALMAVMVLTTVYTVYGVGDNPTAAISFSDTDGQFIASQTVTMTAEFSEPMTTTAALYTKIAITGADTLTATTMTASDTDTFYYLFTPSVTARDGTCTITLSNGQDAETGTIEATPTSGSTFTLDVNAPTAAVTYSDLTPNIGDVVTITANFSENMTTSPAPKIAISGGNTLAAATMTKTDTDTYYYVHTVADGEGTCTVALSVGKDSAGNTVAAAPSSGATFQVNQVGGDYTAAAVGTVAAVMLIAGAAAHRRRTN